MPPPSAIQGGGSVQQGLSAAYESFAFCKYCLAADKRYSLDLMNTPTLPTPSFHAPCRRCAADTPHQLIGECKKFDHANDGPIQIDFCETYSLIQCQVCKQGRMRQVFWNSENDDSPAEYFPPGRRRREPAWIDDLEDKYKGLLQEVYAAYDAGYTAIAAMGARAALDVWVSSQTPNIKGFSKKLEELRRLGTLNARQIELLVPTFDAGSGAAHRGYRPDVDDTLTVIEAVEHVLHQDLFAVRVQRLKKNTPPRE